MAEFLLVDGYNIIFAWDMLKSIAEDSLVNARLKLIDILSDYQGSTGADVILVFDAHKVKESHGHIERHGNLQVVYTKEAETADSYIEKTARKLLQGAVVRVATNDYLEQIIIMSHGARRVSASGLLEEINAIKKRQRLKYIENRPIKQNPLFDRLDEKTAGILEQMRRNNGR